MLSPIFSYYRIYSSIDPLYIVDEPNGSPNHPVLENQIATLGKATAEAEKPDKAEGYESTQKDTLATTCQSRRDDEGNRQKPRTSTGA